MTSTALNMCLRCGFIEIGEKIYLLKLELWSYPVVFFLLILLVLETMKKQIKHSGSLEISAGMTNALKSCTHFLFFSVLLPEVILQFMDVTDLMDGNETGLKVFTTSFIFNNRFIVVRFMWIQS